MSDSSCMKNSFCYLSAHGFLRVSQGQMPGGWRGPICLTVWRVFLLAPWRPLGAGGHGPGVPSLGELPAGPWPVPHPHAGQLLFPLGGFRCAQGSLFGLPPLPPPPPGPHPPGQRVGPLLWVHLFLPSPHPSSLPLFLFFLPNLCF